MFTMPVSKPGLNLLGSGISAYGQYQSGRQAESAYNYNASLAEQNATVVRQSQQLTEYQKKKNLEAQVGHQIAQYAGSGVDVNTGSPIDVMTDTLSKGYLDIAIDKYNAELSARGYESEAAMKRYEGKQIRRESTLQAGLGLLKGATTYQEKMTETKDIKET